MKYNKSPVTDALKLNQNTLNLYFGLHTLFIILLCVYVDCNTLLAFSINKYSLNSNQKLVSVFMSLGSPCIFKLLLLSNELSMTDIEKTYSEIWCIAMLTQKLL